MRAARFAGVTLALLGLGVAPSVAGEGVSFTPLGHLGTGDTSFATDVSADGSVVVGYSQYDASNSNREAFRWTAATGLVGLGGLGAAPVDSRALAVSADGSVVVGSDGEAFRWTAADGIVSIGTLKSGQSAAMGISDDGAVIVGWSDTSSGRLSFRWTQATGIVNIGALPSSHMDSFASGASADGSVICGQSMSGDDFAVEPIRWTQADGMVGLGDLPGGLFYGLGFAISADGSVIAGEAISDFGWESFRWTAETGLQSLDPNAALTSSSFARGISPDGSVIVGSSGVVGGASLWTERHGFIGVQDVLESEGLDLTGWTLRYANAISYDKRTLVGYGTNPAGELEAWVATIPAICAGDTNGDFEVNIADLGIVLAQFGQTGAGLGGDLNGDLAVNISDLAIVLGSFGASC